MNFFDDTTTTTNRPNNCALHSRNQIKLRINDTEEKRIIRFSENVLSYSLLYFHLYTYSFYKLSDVLMNMNAV